MGGQVQGGGHYVRGSLNRAQRERDLDAVLSGASAYVDLLVVGGGITGAGVALDAASRGYSVLLVERRDLAHGTSRFSSKLVHGGLRYLANGDVAVAHESAVERHILMTRTAPHLVHPLMTVLPVYVGTPQSVTAIAQAGLWAGDVLRVSAGTAGALLPRSRRVDAGTVLDHAPELKPRGLRGGFVYWDGQLEDDVRLVLAVARTAATYGARVVTRCTARELSGDGALLQDELSGERLQVSAAAVINATGVWAGRLVRGLDLRPSRGSHLILPAAALGNPRCAVAVPIPGENNRYVFALPEPADRVFVGVTDEPAHRDLPEVAEPTDEELDFLIGVLDNALQRPVRRTDVIGAYAGLRPLVGSGDARTADISRRHITHRSPDGVVTIVGGKLTTYRRMAADAVDAAVAAAGLPWTPSRTARLPLVGAADRGTLGRLAATARLVARYGTEATLVAAEADGDPHLLEPLAPGVPVTAAELLFGLHHEGALCLDDLLARRTRVALVPDDAARVRPAVDELLAGELPVLPVRL